MKIFRRFKNPIPQGHQSFLENREAGQIHWLLVGICLTWQRHQLFNELNWIEKLYNFVICDPSRTPHQKWGYLCFPYQCSACLPLLAYPLMGNVPGRDSPALPFRMDLPAALSIVALKRFRLISLHTCNHIWKLSLRILKATRHENILYLFISAEQVNSFKFQIVIRWICAIPYTGRCHLE